MLISHNSVQCADDEMMIVNLGADYRGITGEIAKGYTIADLTRAIEEQIAREARRPGGGGFLSI